MCGECVWCMHMCVLTFVCAVFMLRGQRKILSVLLSVPLFSLETGSLPEPGARLEVSKSQWYFCLCFPYCWGFRQVHAHTWLFIGAED